MRIAIARVVQRAVVQRAVDISKQRVVSLTVMTATGISVRSYLPMHEIGTNRSRNAVKAFRETGVRVM